jgi:hypothetical protein
VSRPALSWLRGRRPPVQRAAEQPAYRLLEARSYALAGANMLGSAAVGLLALYGGVVLGRAL